MDNKKIGKLIASLRKKQGLTQQDLGDKVGVGFRAVSKWERGLTLPDISIINELSKILGISSDELLSGELNKENKTKEKKKIPKSIKITISIITLIILIVTTTIIYKQNKTYVYDIKNIDNADYYVEGQVIFKNKNLSIIISKLTFRDKEFNKTNIENYEYDIVSGNKHLFGYGKHPNGIFIEENLTIEKMTNNFRVNYAAKTDLTKEEIIDNGISIKIKFIDKNKKEIDKEIKTIVTLRKNKD